MPPLAPQLTSLRNKDWTCFWLLGVKYLPADTAAVEAATAKDSI
jgi:hypothetical protein